MVKKNPVNLNASSALDTEFAKMSVKERGKNMALGGMPDDWDEKNIARELQKFEARNPGLIKRMAAQVAKEVQMTAISKDAVIAKQTDLQRAFWLPAGLQEWMELAYPTFWHNKKHITWFCRHFEVFAYKTYTKYYKVK